MKISSVEFIPVRIPLVAPFKPAWMPDETVTARSGTLIKVHTDDDITGYGWQNSSGMEIKVVGESDNFRKNIVGLELSEFERAIKFLSNLPVRMYGIEVGMWDAFGKSLGQPIYRLIGGAAQKRVLAYASTAEMKAPKEQAEDALKYWNMGFRAIKIRSHHDVMEDDLAVISAMRALIPSEMRIMVDANQASPPSGPIWSYDRALKTARELEKLDVTWLEEPLYHEAHEDLARLCSEVDIPIAGAEDEQGFFRFKDLLSRDCFDLVQPDIATSGGILQSRKVAIISESMNRMMVPHSFDTGISLASALQVAGASPNVPYIEYAMDLPALDLGHEPLLKTPINVGKDGYVVVPSKPGLGIEIDEQVVEKCKV
ncbi:MAG: mandelate racemase/muconate lactonizing enzyme family protein [Thaumarchaeota archaeon]|nr:mandelate racemase/muconate lactonizing enzyme family protein [Nitrososphaerota archaeon]